MLEIGILPLLPFEIGGVIQQVVIGFCVVGLVFLVVVTGVDIDLYFDEVAGIFGLEAHSIECFAVRFGDGNDGVHVAVGVGLPEEFF